MVLKSPAEPPGSREDGVILGVVPVNGTRQRFRQPMLGTSTQSPTANFHLRALTLPPASGAACLDSRA
jgi:hypothetical protein